MGITAENIAEQWGQTREQLDEFAAWSQQKAVAAQEAGKFDAEIVPVEVKKKKKPSLSIRMKALVREPRQKALQSFVLHSKRWYCNRSECFRNQ